MKKLANRSRELPGMLLGACAVLATIFAGSGCNSAEKEKEPIVSVQVAPAKRSAVAETLPLLQPAASLPRVEYASADIQFTSLVPPARGPPASI